LVVLWGPRGPIEAIRFFDDVTVIDGDELVDWCLARAELAETVDQVDVQKAWEALTTHVRLRDRHDDATQDDCVNLDRVVNQVLSGTSTGLLTVIAFAFVSTTWAFPLSGATALLVWRLRHRTRHSLALGAAAVVAGVPTAGVLILSLVTLVLRQLP
jgi:hypothetical protein